MPEAELSSLSVGRRLISHSLLWGRRLAAHPAARVVATLLAVAVFAHSVNLGAAVSAFAHLNWQWTVLAFAFGGLSVVASVIEWGALLRGAGKALGWRYIGGWYMKGLFINQCLPAGVGSDAVRAVQVGRVAGHGPVIASLIGSRMAGTLGMAVWGLVGALLLHAVFRMPDLVGFASFSGAMLLAWGLALGAEHLIARLRGRESIAPAWLRHPLRKYALPFVRALANYRGRPAALAVSILAGAVGWGLNLFSMEMFSRALGYDVSWIVFALALPIALVVTFIPISANGIGIREGVLVFLLVQFHVPIGVAVALSLFMDVQLLPFAISGGLLHLCEATLRRSYRCLAQARPRGPMLRAVHNPLHYVVAPESVLELSHRSYR